MSYDGQGSFSTFSGCGPTWTSPKVLAAHPSGEPNYVPFWKEIRHLPYFFHSSYQLFQLRACSIQCSTVVFLLLSLNSRITRILRLLEWNQMDHLLPFAHSQSWTPIRGLLWTPLRNHEGPWTPTGVAAWLCFDQNDTELSLQQSDSVLTRMEHNHYDYWNGLWKEV